MFYNKIRPYHRDAHHRHESRYAYPVPQVGVLNVEVGGLHGSEARLNQPSLFVSGNSLFRTVEADEDLKFGSSIRILNPASRQINVLALQKIEFVVELLLSELQGVEEMPCSHLFADSGFDYPKVLLDSDVVPDVHEIEPSDPCLADELPVSHKAIDAIRSEKTDEAFLQLLAFFPIGVAVLVKQAEKQCLYR